VNNDEWMEQQQAYQQEMLGYARQRAAARRMVGGVLIGGAAGYMITILALCVGIPLLCIAVWMLVMLCSVIYHWPWMLIIIGPLFRLLWAKYRRDRSSAALSRRADEQHYWVLCGHPCGIYGDYPPAQLRAPNA
jgi:hypothetical protein